MKYLSSIKFSVNTFGELIITISTLGNKGITPTETSNLVKELHKKVNGYGFTNNLKIDISPKHPKKLNNALIDYIKRKEEDYTKRNSGKNLRKYDYYALTLHALITLKYVDSNGSFINQSVFSEAIGLRRPTLCKYYSNLTSVDNNTDYLEIERNLFYFGEL